ncbi:MAG: ferredoxin [Ichthyobacteriaceae bacterium]|nr:ferredoxin [Ichthyobacteriaceae bacterium]
MIVITFQRNKCIGCNYCVENAPNNWVMSSIDGKASLLESKEKKGFYTLKTYDDAIYIENKSAQDNCPAKLITVKKI